ncbi:MAG TPA: hypothetical protein VKF41_00145 [Bryobacteraceae bacterium]|nr:hypothetical protein [Bryobacteraceae bacterium]
MPPRPAPRAQPAEKAPPQSPPKPPPRWLRPLIAALALVYAIGLFSRPFSDTDSWWQLKTGQYIATNRKLPVPDPFSYTTARSAPASPAEERIRHFNLTHEWLAQVGMYGVYSVARFGGIVLARALLLCVFCALVGFAARHRGAGFYGSLAAALAAASIMPFLAADRPQIVTYVLLALTVYLLETRRFLWALPPIFLFWANAHGGFVIGWIAVGAYCAEALFLRWRGRPVADERRLWMVAAASVAISTLNPNGWRVIQVLADYRRSPLQSTLTEWQRTNYWEVSPFNAVLYGSLLTLLWAGGKARFVDWLLYGMFAVAALSVVRNIFLIALIGPVILAVYLPWKRALPVAGEYAVALLLAAAVAWRCMSPVSFQFRADESDLPKGAAGFLLAHHVTAPMFNTYVEGGYLIWKLWPQERVFTDGRALSESAFQESVRIEGNADSTGGKSAERLLADYGIEVILMNGFEYFTGRVYYLPAALSDPSQKEWKLVFADSGATVFMRHPPPGVQPLNSLEALTSMERQCAAHVRLFPFENGCQAELGKLFSLIGDPVRAQKWASKWAESGGQP